jgi:hypothetical protein
MPEDQRQNTRGEGADGGPSPADRIRPFMWKKGQSGNPGGRPKNESMTARLRRVLAQEHNGREIADLIAERLVKEALSGKHPFIKELLDRVEGPVNQHKPDHDRVVRIEVVDVASGVVTPVSGLREFYSRFPAPLPGCTPQSPGT